MLFDCFFSGVVWRAHPPNLTLRNGWRDLEHEIFLRYRLVEYMVSLVFGCWSLRFLGFYTLSFLVWIQMRTNSLSLIPVGDQNLGMEETQ